MKDEFYLRRNIMDFPSWELSETNANTQMTSLGASWKDVFVSQ